jgi:23S rRNA (guanine745-N1)-methyltransferase
MHAEIVARLRCPVCRAGLVDAPGALRCATGHSFDVARQGYVNLLAGRPPASPDTADMVAARAAVQAAGHFAPLAAAVSAAVPAGGGLVVDVGAGTGYYLAAVLDRCPDRLGLAVDVATPAVRRAARAHPRADAVAADAWSGLPLADGCADVLLDVFAPRNGPDFHRVLRPGGTLLVVTPRPDHLAGLAPPLAVDPEKEQRLEVTLGGWFRLEETTEYRYQLELTPTDARLLLAMGPNAHHAATGTPAGPVSVSVTLRRYSRS